MKRLLQIGVPFVAAASLAMVVFFAPSASAEGTEEASEEIANEVTVEKAAINVRPRLGALEEAGNYPCTECHDGESQKANPAERELEDEHDELSLKHGGDRFWCLTCHNKDHRDSLIDLKGRKVSFDDSHLVCIQCHSMRAGDFYRGAHGKRIANWQGDREIQACVECHSPHSPAIKPRQPVAMPKLRKGLPVPKVHAVGEAAKPWEKIRLSRELPKVAKPEKKETK